MRNLRIVGVFLLAISITIAYPQRDRGRQQQPQNSQRFRTTQPSQFNGVNQQGFNPNQGFNGQNRGGGSPQFQQGQNGFNRPPNTPGFGQNPNSFNQFQRPGQQFGGNGNNWSNQQFRAFQPSFPNSFQEQNPHNCFVTGGFNGMDGSNQGFFNPFGGCMHNPNSFNSPQQLPNGLNLPSQFNPQFYQQQNHGFFDPFGQNAYNFNNPQQFPMAPQFNPQQNGQNAQFNQQLMGNPNGILNMNGQQQQQQQQLMGSSTQGALDMSNQMGPPPSQPMGQDPMIQNQNLMMPPQGSLMNQDPNNNQINAGINVNN